jgi:hypothetical protein
LGALFVVVAALAGCGSSHKSHESHKGAASSAPKVTYSKPMVVSATELHALARKLSYPIYWNPKLAGRNYELTRGSNGSVEIRYLNQGEVIGTPKQDVLAILTYPEPNAYRLVQQGAARKGALVRHRPGNVLLVSPPDRLANAFFAAPASKVLVEVYDPTPGRSEYLVELGDIQPL